MKPRRVVMTFGTNDTGMEVQDFISNYTALVQAIQAAYPPADMRCQHRAAAVPENHSSYPHMDQAKYRRLQHGTAEHVRAAGPQVPQHGCRHS